MNGTSPAERLSVHTLDILLLIIFILMIYGDLVEILSFLCAGLRAILLVFVFVVSIQVIHSLVFCSIANPTQKERVGGQ